MASLLHLSKKEISLSLGSDTLHFNNMHQSQVSLVNPAYKASTHACMHVHVYMSLFHFLFSFPFPHPQEVNEQNMTLFKY